MSDITQEEIRDLVLHRGLTMEKLIDVVIDINGIIGVGRISLAEELKEYIYHHPDTRKTKRVEEKVISDEAVKEIVELMGKEEEVIRLKLNKAHDLASEELNPDDFIIKGEINENRE